MPGKFLELSMDFLDDDGCEIRRMRRAPHISNENKKTAISYIEFDCNKGVGIDGSGQGEDPVIMVRFSKDGGKTWSNERRVTVGEIGRFAHRARTRRLGNPRDFVLEAVVTDPVDWAFVNCYLEMGAGTE